MNLIFLNSVDNTMKKNYLRRMKLLVLLLFPYLLVILLEQYLLDHENDMFMNERREIDEVFLQQVPILKHNLPVEILGDPPPPKGDPVFELKLLPDNLKYAYLDEKKIYPVIISANLSEQEEERLLKTLKKHCAAIGYTLDDLKGITPTLCQHKINLEADAKPVRDPQDERSGKKGDIKAP